MNQKAQSGIRTILLGVIVFSVVALLMFGVISQLGSFLGREGIEKVCKAEVLAVHNIAKSQLSVGLGSFKKAVCDRVILGELSLSRNEKTAKVQLSKTLIEEAERCWDKFGKGELTPYSGEFGTYFSSIHPRCYVCSSFRIPERYSELDIDAEFEEYVDLRLEAQQFVSEAFIEDDRGARYFGIRSMDQSLWEKRQPSVSAGVSVALPLLSILSSNQYDKRPNFEAVKEWPLEFEGGKTYYVVNIFAVNRDLDLFTLGFLNKNAVRSSIAFIDPTYQKDICILEN